MIVRILTAGVALVAASAAIAAAPGEQTTPADATGAVTEPEKKICRTEKATGSLTRRTRICLTAAQWRDVNDRTRRGVDEMNGNASGGKMCVPNPSDPFQGCPG